MSEPEVLFETLPSTNEKSIGIATLNVEKSLNSLSLAMVDSLRPQLAQWEQDDSIACVILQGSGDKAFCAGGDVVQLYRSACEQNDYAPTFFEREYRLDYQLHTYKKPLIVWAGGIVMGGGLGLMNGGSHRVVTESSLIAMPEITIGLYPDVGGTWFLNRMPGKTGLFLALTGASINGADALFTGLADRFIAQEKRAALVDTLTAVAWSKNPRKHFAQVTHVLREYEQQSIDLDLLPVSQVRAHYDDIQSLCDGDDIDAIVDDILAWSGESRWLGRAVKKLASGCPTTMRLIDEQFRRGKYLSLKEAFQFELILSINCARFGNFREGVRALLIDKDMQPRFSPATLREVEQDYVDAHFKAPWGDAPHPLADL